MDTFFSYGYTLCCAATSCGNGYTIQLEYSENVGVHGLSCECFVHKKAPTVQVPCVWQSCIGLLGSTSVAH